MSKKQVTNWSGASTTDVFVAMMLGWKVWGHAGISWWLVFAPYLAALVLLGVSLIILGAVDLFVK